MQSLLTLISLPAPACFKRSGCGTRNQASSPGIREPLWPPPPCPGSSVTTPASRPSPGTPSTSARTATGSSDAPASGAWTCQPGGRIAAQGTQVKQHWTKLYELGKGGGDGFGAFLILNCVYFFSVCLYVSLHLHMWRLILQALMVAVMKPYGQRSVSSTNEWYVTFY